VQYWQAFYEIMRKIREINTQIGAQSKRTTKLVPYQLNRRHKYYKRQQIKTKIDEWENP